MLKKAAIVAATAVALTLAGGTAALAAPATNPPASVAVSHGQPDYISFPEAYSTFIWGGGALGAGAAALIAGAYAGIATTPAEVLHSVQYHHYG